MIKFRINNTSKVIKSVQKSLEQYGEKGQKIAEEAATQLVKEERQLVPVRTGKLKASITMQKTKNGVEVNTQLEPYGKYVEDGTRKMAAKPFVRPALEKVRAMMPMIIKKVLRRKG